jgi:hypothetical protein
VPVAGAVVEVEIIFNSAKDKMTATNLTGTGTVLRIDRKSRKFLGFAATVRFAIGGVRASSNSQQKQ